jgi:hypothetical protein
MMQQLTLPQVRGKMHTMKKKSLTDQLRCAIRNSGITQYRISRDARIDEATLSRFMHGAGLSMESLNAIGNYLDLEIVSKRKTKEAKGS